MVSFEQCLGLQEGRENSLWCNYIGSVYLDRKQLQNAERVYQIALRADEKNIDTRQGLFQVYSQTGKADKAQTHLKVIQQLEEITRLTNKERTQQAKKKLALQK